MENHRDIINGQKHHWENTFVENPDMFGTLPSFPALETIKLIAHQDRKNILELGAGQGRDTLFFAQKGYDVTAVDYYETGLNSIVKKAEKLNICNKLATAKHDIRNKLPFPDDYFDVCFSHMLFCMALYGNEQASLINEVRRVLKPGGFCIYSARNTHDPHFGKGVVCVKFCKIA